MACTIVITVYDVGLWSSEQGVSVQILFLSTRSLAASGEGHVQAHGPGRSCKLGLLLPMNAVACPGNSLQPFQADRTFTVHADSETAIADALQCSLDQTQAAAVSAGA